MPTGDLILEKDYTDIRTKVVNLLGTGSGSSGYGQTIQSPSVSVGAQITKQQYDLLRFDLYNVLFHQTGTVPSIAQPAANSIITYGVSQPNNQFDILANSAITNRFAVVAGQFAERFNVINTTRTAAWSNSISSTITAEFASSNAARFFFNSGGQIRVRTSRSGGAGTSQNNSWTSILSSAGTQTFGAQIPSTGFSPMNGTNFYRLTNGFQRFYTTLGSSPYASNRYSIDAACDVANNASGTARFVYIRVVLDDPYTDPPVGTPPAFAGDIGPEDVIDGSLTTIVDELCATGILQPAPSTGGFTIAAPTYSISAFSGS
jgi:hypothetical protein